MKKTLFFLVKNECEVKKMQDVHEGVTVEQDDQYPETISVFEDKDEALRSLSAWHSSARKMQGNHGSYVLVEEYYVVASIYECDDWSSIDLGNFGEHENRYDVDFVCADGFFFADFDKGE